MQRPGPDARRGSGRLVTLTLLGSAGLHAIAVLAALSPGRSLPTDAALPGLEIELVEQRAEQAGPAPGQSPAAPASPPAADAQAAAAPRPRLASTGAGDIPLPASYAPAVPMPVRPPSPSSVPMPAEVNLGDADQDQMGMTVEGKDVVPPKPNASHRNLPPVWPADLARRRIGGRLSILLHIGTDGRVQGIDLVQSSGQPSLDRAAMGAARLWQFTPARRGGLPVPFDWPYTINFVTGDG